MSKIDAVLDKVADVLEYGDKSYHKLEKKVEPVTKVITPYMDKFADEMDPILQRPIDWILFCYFISHIPITIFFDLQNLYPEWLLPTFLSQVHGSYIALLADPFMDRSRETMWWFKSFSLCEAFLQLPFFFFAAYGLLKDKSWVRLPLAVYGAHVMTTVIPCLVEVMFNQEYYGLTNLQRNCILFLYFPYFLIPLVGLVDSYIRITKVIKVNDNAAKKE
ncbi:uncharacterized protein BX663DRAFT_493083 [Cokeromyces recurvatus]|uniref:uncharacterized protein n=1 Tax=Cokeromyces recurvatus TaxID=90255 RepID=UPI00221F1A7E|nr:uncharacterized protein BX663DRAFT_493083 [Cokeromyces recurvatus]KAI7908132.1 hypothetical protein BX663DRAFT_493083 [Cokeromyces recurvatus]